MDQLCLKICLRYTTCNQKTFEYFFETMSLRPSAHATYPILWSFWIKTKIIDLDK